MLSYGVITRMIAEYPHDLGNLHMVSYGFIETIVRYRE
jgi:hypothetical protein